VGEFSGVDADLLQLAFEELAVETHARGAVLSVCRVPLQAQCGRCAAIFDVAGFRFVCPKCHSMEVTVVRGDELLLDSITLETAT
jgi:hydrogenase nickel incorporation protein HypA/HybF